MRTPIIDGRSIEQFIPLNLRDMFYRHPLPQYKYALHDGLDPYGFTTDGLVLYLPLWALRDSSFESVDAYKHTCDITGALWTPQGRTFDGNDDRITCPKTFLNSVSEFTIMWWDYYASKNDVMNIVFDRVDVSNQIQVYHHTNNGGDMYVVVENGTDNGNGIIAAADVPEGSWNHWTFRFNGAAASNVDKVRVYINGTWVPFDSITDNFPSTTANMSAVDFIIGHSTATLLGTIGEFWVYDRVLSSAERIYAFNATKWRYR